jgi:hypothetical protein
MEIGLINNAQPPIDRQKAPLVLETDNFNITRKSALQIAIPFSVQF